MKKIIRKVKGKKVLSFVLAAIMLATTFNIALPMLKLDAGAISTSDGTGETVTQTQIVHKKGKDHLNIQKYDEYAANYLEGAGYSTGIVIPGLASSEDYVIQGMTYYDERDWFLVTAYHKSGTYSSKVFALSAATGEFEAMFSFLNVPDADGTRTINTDHGGGITVSEHNLYYSCGDKDRKIAYAPLSVLKNAPKGQHTVIKLVAEKDFVEVGSVYGKKSKTAYTAYVCYDEGVLWMGNFFDKGAKLNIGIQLTLAADEYNAPANNRYNSMVFGYKLKGSNSAEEWANLTSGTTDCQGSPTYSIGLNNTLKDVQYATVYNGKLYLSRSYGSGVGNSVSFGFGETSSLTVADIDLSVPGTVPVDIATKETGTLDKTVYAYDIGAYANYSMMPMSEGLCVVDGNIFITFEGASNKYLNESGNGIGAIGNCEKPVDVIWQLDPYEMLDIMDKEPEKSLYYQKVNSLSEIKNGEEYIIVHESAEKDPVTQNKILYALDAYGNFNGHKLSKGTESTVKGYDGMICHAISDYDITEDGKLYLNAPEEDDIENIRWTLENVSGNNYKITSSTKYFANHNSLYFDQNKISMRPENSTDLTKIKFMDSGNGKGGFWLSNNEMFFLWCNDGAYNDTINGYYQSNESTTPIYNGISEKNGTLHCDALNSSGDNIIGAPVPDTDQYKDRIFYIYKRTKDNIASTYESRVYSDLTATLEADGTYTIDLETYAISPNHYLYVEPKPTDYIIVADTSSSMDNSGSTGIKGYNSDLSLDKFCTSDEVDTEIGKPTEDGTSVGQKESVVLGYTYSNSDEDIYFKHSDGQYYKAYVAMRNEFTWSKKGLTGYFKEWKSLQYYYLYYISDDGVYHCFTNQTAPAGLDYTEEEFRNWVAGNGKLQTASGSGSIGERLITGEHYRFDNVNSPKTKEHKRIETLRNAASNLVGQIAAENNANRIALVQFGGTNGFYNTNRSLSTTDTDYANAFWSVGNASDLQNIIANLSTSKLTSNAGEELKHIAGIMSNSGKAYAGENKNQNCVIIYLSDGVAGHDDQNDFTTAADNNIAKALTAKKAGAFIYTVMIGADGTSNSRNLYMEAISSKYAEAASMANLGGQSVDGVNYALSLATTTLDGFINFGKVTLKETSANNAVALDSLNANSILREELSDAFIIPEGTLPQVSFIRGEFDSIGRFAFSTETPNPSGVTASWTDEQNSKTLTVTGYDYATEYIGKGKEGNKLRIRLEGILANPDADITNAAISNIDTTAIYKNSSDMTDNGGNDFKRFPIEYFNIPEYTYVLDYGIDMYDSDVNGTMLALDKGLNAQPRISENEYDYRDESQSGLIEMTNGKQDLIYKMTPTSTGDKGYVLIDREDGTYDWFKIKLVPASNIYYEEDRIVTAGKSGKIEWTQEGTTENVYRDPTIGESVYGYDKHYDDASQQFSNNSYLKVDVTSEKGNTTSKKKSFQFTGTGIDLMSACGENTGVLAVGIKKFDEATQKLKTVKAFMVDTYYNDANVSSLISQVPVVKWEGAYGTYTVDISAVYVANAGGVTKSVAKNNLIDTGLVMNSAEPKNTTDIAAILESAGLEDMIADDMELVWFDDNSIFNGGTGVAPTVKKTRAGEEATVVTLENYIDGFRVYNPLGTDQSAYEASEKNAKYVNVLDNLMTSTGKVGAFGYIIGGENNELTWADYETVGPQGEVYLNKGKSINFTVTVDQAEKVMLGLRAVKGATSVTIAANDTYKVENVPINSATEMYYDITKCFGGVTASNTPVNITITNASGGILAINHVKHSGGDGSVGSGIVTRTNARSTGATEAQDLLFAPFTEANLVDVQNSMNLPGVQGIVKNGVIIPLVEEEDEVPGDNTTPDTGDDTNNDNNDDTNTDSGEKEEFSIFSLLEMLISLIEKILYNAFGAGKMA